MTPYYERAELLLSQGRLQDAEKEVKKHLSEYPEHAYGIALLAQIYLRAKQYDEAQKTIEDAIRINAYEGFFFYIKAIVLINKDKDKEAEDFIALAVNINPAEAEYFAVWSDIKLFQKKYTEALEKADEGLRRDPANVHCLNAKSAAHVKLNQKHDAFSTIEGALNEDPDNAFTHANYGWGLLEKREHEKALVHFREALRLNPQMDYARAGMIEAMKAKYFIYRWFLNYRFWMAKQSRNMQWGLIIGIYVLSRVLNYLAETYPAVQPFVLPIIILIALFAFLTWVIDPLSNLFLRLNKYGRYALNEKQTKVSNYVGISMLVFAIGLVLFLITFQESALALTVFGFTMMVPLSGLFSGDENEKKLNYYALGMAIVGALAVAMTYVSGTLENEVSLVYLIGFMAYQWVANYWRQGRY